MSILQTLRNASLLGLLLCALGDDAQAQWSGRTRAGCGRTPYGVSTYRGLPAQGYGVAGYSSGSSVSVRLGGALGQGAGIRLQRTRVRYQDQAQDQGVWVPAREVRVRVGGTLQRRVVGGYYAQQGATRRSDLGPYRYRSGSSSNVRIRL